MFASSLPAGTALIFPGVHLESYGVLAAMPSGCERDQMDDGPAAQFCRMHRFSKANVALGAAKWTCEPACDAVDGAPRRRRNRPLISPAANGRSTCRCLSSFGRPRLRFGSSFLEYAPIPSFQGADSGGASSSERIGIGGPSDSPLSALDDSGSSVAQKARRAGLIA